MCYKNLDIAAFISHSSVGQLGRSAVLPGLEGLVWVCSACTSGTSGGWLPTPGVVYVWQRWECRKGAVEVRCLLRPSRRFSPVPLTRQVTQPSSDTKGVGDTQTPALTWRGCRVTWQRVWMWGRMQRWDHHAIYHTYPILLLIKTIALWRKTQHLKQLYCGIIYMP